MFTDEFAAILNRVQSGEISFNQAHALAEKLTADAACASDTDGLQYKIIRTYSAGVFAGYVEKDEGKTVVLKDARRLWYWAGAASLSQLAVKGTSKPQDCKFPVAVSHIELTEVIEKLDCTEAAKNSIDSVAIWSA